MTRHMDKAKAVADKIMKKAEDTLANLDREMTVMQWAADYRAIMWGAIAEVASRRAEAARTDKTIVRGGQRG